MVLSSLLSSILFFSSPSIAHFALYVNHLETETETESASNSPSRKGGVLLRSAFSRGATKGVGGPSILLLLLWGFSNQKKRIVGSEISHFRAMIFLLSFYLLEKNFWSGIKHVWKKVSGLYSAKFYFRNFIFCISWNFISKIGISFLKADRGAGFEASPGFPISYPV